MNNLITITESANAHLTDLSKEHNKKYVRLEVKGGGCAGFKYEWSFENDKDNNDEVLDYNNFTLLVDASYKIRVENPDGNAALSSTNILTVSDAPTWSTASGSLGTIAGNFSGTVATLSASSDSAVTYSETTSVLTNASQANCALNSSTGAITTSDFGGSSTTATLR